MTDLKKFCMSIEQASNLKKFCMPIEQASNQGIEKANCKAIKFDDKDGFVRSLATNYANNHKVDYIEIIENGLIMIEMKDLQLKIINNFQGKPTSKELESIFKNMIDKFTHSLKIIQQNIDPNLMPVVNYLVWKNNTEIIMMDRFLPKEFKDRPYQICKTNEICKKLSTFDMRLCQ